MPKKTLLVSIRPAYAAMIFSGIKSVELRRTRPRVSTGDRLAIYVSSPTRTLSGVAEIVELHEGTPQSMWRLVGAMSGLTKDEFMTYFAGAEKAYAIALGVVCPIAQPKTLGELRAGVKGFSPPQVYRYLQPTDLQAFGIAPLSRVA